MSRLPSEALSGDTTSREDVPDIFCPQCDYNLKGTVEDRCPECGEPFDRARLVDWTTTSDLPPPFGELDAERDASVHVFLATLRTPRRLGRELPPRVELRDVRAYGRMIRLIVSFCLVGPIALVAGDLVDALVIGLIAAIVVWLASRACEELTALMLARFVEPRAVREQERHAFWRALCCCFSTYLLLMTAWAIVCVLTIAVIADYAHVSRTAASVTVSLLMAGVPAIFAWWSFAVARAVSARGLPGPARTVCACLVPVVGLGSVALAYLLTMLVGSACLALYELI